MLSAQMDSESLSDHRTLCLSSAIGQKKAESSYSKNIYLYLLNKNHKQDGLFYQHWKKYVGKNEFFSWFSLDAVSGCCTYRKRFLLCIRRNCVWKAAIKPEVLLSECFCKLLSGAHKCPFKLFQLSRISRRILKSENTVFTATGPNLFDWGIGSTWPHGVLNCI